MKMRAILNNLNSDKYHVRYNLEKAAMLVRRCMPHSQGLTHTYLGNISNQIENLLEATEHYGEN